MAEMLTAKDMHELLQVDRSTIYRMADRGELPAVKVGKQWRFPRDSVATWLGAQTPAAQSAVAPEPPAVSPVAIEELAPLLPLDCVQLILNAFSDLLGVMLVIADLDGIPLTAVSNPTPLYDLLANTEDGPTLCRETWRELGREPALTPHFKPGLGNLLCARAFVRLQNELKGMVIAFGVATEEWALSRPELEELARTIHVDLDSLYEVLQAAPRLAATERERVALALQRIADIVAHIAEERHLLVGRLREIARLSTL